MGKIIYMTGMSKNGSLAVAKAKKTALPMVCVDGSYIVRKMSDGRTIRIRKIKPPVAGTKKIISLV